MSQPIRIVLADDHAILRAGLKLLLSAQPGWQVVGEAQNGQEALELTPQLQPDVLLLDLNMPILDGISAIPSIKAAAPKTAILILTMHDDGDYLQKAIQAGANGYVLKKVVDTELLIAIQAVLRGEIYVQSAMTHFLINPKRPPQTNADPWQSLSEREYEVLKRVALGYTNVEIAEELFLSAKTVETYRARGMEKLNLQTRAQLVKSALEHGHLE
jgi:DNA-binding NarL/FixJ family response regulator